MSICRNNIFLFMEFLPIYSFGMHHITYSFQNTSLKNQLLNHCILICSNGLCGSRLFSYAIAMKRTHYLKYVHHLKGFY